MKLPIVLRKMTTPGKGKCYNNYLDQYISGTDLIIRLLALNLVALIGANLPPTYIPNKMDLMYMNKTPADEIAVVPEQVCEPCTAINQYLVHLDRPRQGIILR